RRTGRRRSGEQGDRRSSVPQHQHGGEEPLQRLPETRRPLPHRARSTAHELNPSGFPQLKVARFRPSVGVMELLVYYTVQLARPAEGWTQLEQLIDRARETSQQLRGEGIPVRFLRSVFVPEDDTCLLVYQGPTADAVHVAAQKAELKIEWVREAIKERKSGKES